MLEATASLYKLVLLGNILTDVYVGVWGIFSIDVSEVILCRDEHHSSECLPGARGLFAMDA